MAVASRSRPGDWSYENQKLGERIAWIPKGEGSEMQNGDFEDSVPSLPAKPKETYKSILSEDDFITCMDRVIHSHELQLSPIKGKFSCDICEKKGNIFYSCRPCDYDECWECYTKAYCKMPTAPSLPRGWSAIVTEKSITGEWNYENKFTKKIFCEIPTADACTLPLMWELVQNDEGSWCYRNGFTNEMVVDVPTKEAVNTLPEGLKATKHLGEWGYLHKKLRIPIKWIPSVAQMDILSSLPIGWFAISSSKSEFSYQNQYTMQVSKELPVIAAPKLPKGWKLKEKPRLCFINEYTKETVTSLPTLPAAELPEGWKAVPSQSRPGEFSYENIYTKDRIQWIPTAEACKKTSSEFVRDKLALFKIYATKKYNTSPPTINLHFNAPPETILDLNLKLGDTRSINDGCCAEIRSCLLEYTVSELVLQGNAFKESGFRLIVEAINKNPTLVNVDLRKCEIDDEMVTILAVELISNTVLTSLYLQGNVISNSGARELAAMLKFNKCISIFWIDNNDISSEAEEEEEESIEIQSPKSLKPFLLSGSPTKKRFSSLVSPISVLTTDSPSYGQSFELDYTKLPLGRVLADALEKNSSLTSVNLSGNDFGPSVIRKIANAMKINATITTLMLNATGMKVEGALALSEMLIVNTSLTCLEMGGNDIGTVGCKAIVSALVHNTSLEELNYEENSIGTLGANSFSVMLQVNTTLRTLKLGKNSICDEGVKFIVTALKVNTTLASLHLDNNSVGSKGVQHVLDMLLVNVTLKKIYLNNNQIVADDIISITTLLNQYNFNITVFDIPASHSTRDLADVLLRNVSPSTSISVLAIHKKLTDNLSKNVEYFPDGCSLLIKAILTGADCNTILSLLDVFPQQAKELESLTRAYPLHLAISRNINSTVLRRLYDLNPAMLQQRNNTGFLPLHLAIMHRIHISGLKVILQGWSLAAQEKDACGRFPFQMAVSHKSNADIIILILKAWPAAGLQCVPVPNAFKYRFTKCLHANTTGIHPHVLKKIRHLTAACNKCNKKEMCMYTCEVCDYAECTDCFANCSVNRSLSVVCSRRHQMVLETNTVTADFAWLCNGGFGEHGCTKFQTGSHYACDICFSKCCIECGERLYGVIHSDTTQEENLPIERMYSIITSFLASNSNNNDRKEKEIFDFGGKFILNTPEHYGGGKILLQYIHQLECVIHDDAFFEKIDENNFLVTLDECKKKIFCMDEEKSVLPLTTILVAIGSLTMTPPEIIVDKLYTQGMCYFRALNGVPESNADAFMFFKEAASLGHAAAMIDTGRCYLHGYGVTANSLEASRWYAAGRKALLSLTKPNGIALYRLAQSFYNAEGCEEDLVRAEYYYARAFPLLYAAAELGALLYYFLCK